MEVDHVVRQLCYTAIILISWLTHIGLEIVAIDIDLRCLWLSRWKHAHHWMLITNYCRMTYVWLIHELINTRCLTSRIRRRYLFFIKIVAHFRIASLILILILGQVQVTHVFSQHACRKIWTKVWKKSRIVCRIRMLPLVNLLLNELSIWPSALNWNRLTTNKSHLCLHLRLELQACIWKGGGHRWIFGFLCWITWNVL